MLETVESYGNKPKGLPRASKPFRAKQARDNRQLRANTLDLAAIRSYAEVGCTLDEIAGLLGVSSSWLDTQKKNNPDLEGAILAGNANLRSSLRSAQVRLALTGHPTMLIWLGKQFLGQSDKQEIKQENTLNVVLQDAVRELRELGRDEVLKIKQIIEKGPENDSSPQIIDN